MNDRAFIVQNHRIGAALRIYGLIHVAEAIRLNPGIKGPLEAELQEAIKAGMK